MKKNNYKWENYGKGEGKWEFDHIKLIGISDLTNEEFIKRLHYTNIQPLLSIDNAKKNTE